MKQTRNFREASRLLFLLPAEREKLNKTTRSSFFQPTKMRVGGVKHEHNNPFYGKHYTIVRGPTYKLYVSLTCDDWFFLLILLLFFFRRIRNCGSVVHTMEATLKLLEGHSHNNFMPNANVCVIGHTRQPSKCMNSVFII